MERDIKKLAAFLGAFGAHASLESDSTLCGASGSTLLAAAMMGGNQMVAPNKLL